MLSHFRLLGFRGVVYIEHPQKHYCFIKKVDQKREDKIDLILDWFNKNYNLFFKKLTVDC